MRVDLVGANSSFGNWFPSRYPTVRTFLMLCDEFENRFSFFCSLFLVSVSLAPETQFYAACLFGQISRRNRWTEDVFMKYFTAPQDRDYEWSLLPWSRSISLCFVGGSIRIHKHLFKFFWGYLRRKNCLCEHKKRNGRKGMKEKKIAAWARVDWNDGFFLFDKGERRYSEHKIDPLLLGF